MKSPNDIEYLVKQANILGRLFRGSKGALKGGLGGALMGGAAGVGAALTGGLGLPAALGAGGAGLFSGAKVGGGIGSKVFGIRGLLGGGAKNLASLERAVAKPMAADIMLPRGIPLAVGAGAGYLLSGDDNKMLGAGIGALAGLAARPSIVKALQRRAGRM